MSGRASGYSTPRPACPGREVLIRVERAQPVDSPAYTFGHWSEDDLKRAWAATYDLAREQPCHRT